MLPPAYGSDDGMRLPAYTAPRARTRRTIPTLNTQHIITLASSQQKPWAVLHISSCAALPEQTPTFFEGDVISGTLQLVQPRDNHVIAVDIEVSCLETALFLDADFSACRPIYRNRCA